MQDALVLGDTIINPRHIVRAEKRGKRAPSETWEVLIELSSGGTVSVLVNDESSAIDTMGMVASAIRSVHQ